MKITKYGSAKWRGDLKSGKGRICTESGALTDRTYGFNTRFEDDMGTNPEELIGAAHAACYSMAMSLILGHKDLTADEISTKAHVTIEEQGGGFAITKVHLDVTARISGCDAATFKEVAEATRDNCPVSKLLTGATITMDATLK